jgi:hypothetical protein
MPCDEHREHQHVHGPGCGHVAVQHGDHVDYLHEGHLHHPHEAHVDEHVLEVCAEQPARCTEGRRVEGHPATHVHGPDCGHDPVPHGDHVDFLVDGRLHHPHAGHCDDHGPVITG